MHKYRHAARRNAWYSDNEGTNYNPFAKRATRPTRQETWDGSSVESTNPAPNSRLHSEFGPFRKHDAGFGSLSDLDLHVGSSQEEADLGPDFTDLSPNTKNEPVKVPVKIELDAQPDHAQNTQPALVASSQKPPLKGQDLLWHRKSLIFVEYGSRNPLASSK